ncbi:MAG TPA: protoporphyrinogen oxidase [Terriglobales bacterium]|nr:protoporphyrinogen oxidase [Terriglobales bacterium]
MKRIAIVGGGIAGLSAAFALDQARLAGVDVKYTLFESSPRLGGVLKTEFIDECLVEAGADSFLTEKPWAADLCKQIGLGDQLIGSNDAFRKTYILRRGKLVPLPDGLMFMVPTRIRATLFSPLFSFSTKLRMAREWFRRKQCNGTDESVASFVRRHYGNEVVEYLADPLLTGVYGGDASQLGVRAVLPRFADMEASHGSLGRGMVAARKKARGSTPRPLFSSLKNGMQQMVDAVVASLNPGSLLLNAEVLGIQAQDSGWVVSAGYKTDHFDAVILAIPTHLAGMLMSTASASLAKELSSIPYSSSVTVALGYGNDVRRALPPGFGFLVPHREGKRMMAATFVHNKFPHRVPEGRALIRCALGGARDEGMISLTDEEILLIVRDELKQILGVTAEPSFTRIYRWSKAMAQYTVGHLDRVKKIEGLLPPGIFLAGNGYRGIGVPDCVRTGKEAAEAALAACGFSSSAS